MRDGGRCNSTRVGESMPRTDKTGHKKEGSEQGRILAEFLSAFQSVQSRIAISRTATISADLFPPLYCGAMKDCIILLCPVSEAFFSFILSGVSQRSCWSG